MNELKLSSTDIIDQYANHLTDEQLRVAPLLAFGMTARKASEQLKIPYPDILLWSRTSPHMRSLINELRSYSNRYHKNMLNQAAVMAWDRVFEFLGQEYDEMDKDNRNIQARLAQFIISELGLKESKTTVEHIVPNLKVEDSSLDILARKVANLQREEIDAEYSVGGATDVTANLQQPNLLTSEVQNSAAQYPIAKNTKYGSLSFDGLLIICHKCGEATDDLITHIRSQHNLSPANYRTMYQLPADTKLYFQES